jgi:16S rRNA C967 or C1407 C5-methylase (RsmB/RsmF family)/NOL1/NOP2/fmu family ribosome biogenesis protein
MRSLLGADADSFFAALERATQTSIRLNPAKKAELPFSTSESVPWCSYGYYLPTRPSFITDPLWHAGAYYVQEASSMFLAQAFNYIRSSSSQPLTVLDACAAPGGKSTLALSYLHNTDLLVSNESIRSRVGMLTDNLQRWGYSNVIVSHNDPQQLGRCTHFFDVLMVDAPCSGEGLFRKDAAAVDQWSESHVLHCAARQQRILADLLPALKPGGYLLYSTCTYNTLENEAQLKELILQGYECVNLSIPDEWGIVQITESNGCSMHAYRFMPHKLKGEGFFMAMLRKPIGTSDILPAKEKHIRSAGKPVVETSWSQYLKQPYAYETFLTQKSTLRLIQKPHAAAFLYLQNRLNVLVAGIEAGEWKGKTFIPSHALSLSTDFVCEQRAEVGKEHALAYLRRDTLPREVFGAPGRTAVTYEGLVLGWVNVLPNRINNYFPTALRVLKQSE